MPNCSCGKRSFEEPHSMCWSCRIIQLGEEVKNLKNINQPMINPNPFEYLYSAGDSSLGVWNKLDENVKEKKMNLKEEFIDAGSLVMVNQVSKVAIESIKKIVEMIPNLSKNDKKVLVKLLDTDLGRAACLLLIGTVLPQVPQFNNKKAAKLFHNIRQTGLVMAGNDIVESVMAPILKKFTGKEEVDVDALMMMDPGSALAFIESQSQLGGALTPFMKVMKKFQLMTESGDKEATIGTAVTA